MGHFRVFKNKYKDAHPKPRTVPYTALTTCLGCERRAVESYISVSKHIEPILWAWPCGGSGNTVANEKDKSLLTDLLGEEVDSR